MTELTRCQPLNNLNTVQWNFHPSDLLFLTYSETRTKPHGAFYRQVTHTNKQYSPYRDIETRMIKMFMNDHCKYSVLLCLRIIKQKCTLGGSIKTKFKIWFYTLLINVICLQRHGYRIFMCKYILAIDTFCKGYRISSSMVQKCLNTIIIFLILSISERVIIK